MKTLNLTIAQGNLKKSNKEAPLPPHQMATPQSLTELNLFTTGVVGALAALVTG